MQLYRASDKLVAYRDSIEDYVFQEAMTMFGLERTVTLFDLTNTYLEGEAEQIPLAKHGHSKEKRLSVAYARGGVGRKWIRASIPDLCG